ncbi:MAG: hypothetical protein M3Y23_03215 [Actinomycetota bacterium]|nr:hypothetical protein [Actinomycetota bacterium]
MALGEARPGYELWRPNRSKASSLTARFAVILLLLVSAALMLLVVFGGWSILVGGSTYGIVGIIFALVYVLIAVMVFRWSRGALTVTIAFAVLLLIFCAVGAGSWFARDKPGFSEAALPSDLIGVIVLILIPVQLMLAVAAAISFTQEWHVEEERFLGEGEGTPREVKASRGASAPTAPAQPPDPSVQAAARPPRSAARVNPSGPT